MFYRYEIRNNGKEDILYLYLTMTYEFSKDLESKHKDKNILQKTKNFINNNSINFKGKKVYLVVDGIIIKAFNIDKEYTLENIKNSSKYSNNNYIVKVKYQDNTFTQMTLKNYLLGVIATNKILNLEFTTLKVLAVLYRTYAYKQMKQQGYIAAINQFQIYKPISYFKIIWTDKFKEKYNLILKAIEDTDGEFVTYNNDYIYPFIHISNNGFTNELETYKYLKRKSSIWDYASPYYLEIKDFDYNQLEKLFNIKKDSFKNINILSINKSNQIERIKIGDKEYSGEHIRSILGLKSSDINIIVNPSFVRVITKGWGNQLGLSQFGANEIAKAGCSYISIINYYYDNVVIKKYQ